MWDAAKGAGVGYRADLVAGSLARSRGELVEGARRYARGYREALAAGDLQPIDTSLEAPMGRLAYRELFAEWRARVLSTGSPEDILGFLATTRRVSDPGAELSRAFEALRARGADGVVLDELAQRLLDAGRAGDAWSLVEPRLAERSYDILMLASNVAERQGRLLEAARYYEEALDAREPTSMTLAELRELHRRLVELYARTILAEPSGESSRRALTSALAALARWRADDADNPEIDKRAFVMLSAVGQKAEALRHLSSIIERHPGEASAYSAVADALEEQGQDASAERARAIELEPTNPTWLLRRAEGLLGSQGEPAARALLEQIAHGTWQPRFSDVVAQARDYLNRSR